MLSYGLRVSPGGSLGFSLLCLQRLLAEAEGNIGTTVSLMLVLSICLVPWTLHLSPLALPKHHLLAMSLLRSGGSRMGSSSGKAGRDR